MQRKIIHIDMDAFFASIEQRDNPELRGKPIVVGGKPGSRGVVATASYEARKFGIRSAMSSNKAFELCPDAIFISPRFDAYKEASQTINGIFSYYTSKIETLSLDEAYLDITTSTLDGVTATEIAKQIRSDIFDKTSLTASAGVSVNKLVSKIASDYNKPDGLTVVPPEKVSQFLSEMSVRKIPGVGKVMEEKLAKLGIVKIKQLRSFSKESLFEILGKSGYYLYDSSFGIDEREVSPYRERKSLGAEDTFFKDLIDLEEIKHELLVLSEKVSARLKNKKLKARTITLKITYSDFKKITRAKTNLYLTDSPETLFDTCFSILLENDLFLRPIRLLGITCSNFHLQNSQEAGDTSKIKQLSFNFEAFR